MISAVILSHDDEKTLARTLESTAWCDQTVVIDDNSSDNSVAVAKRFTPLVYQRALAGDFAGQRNFGLSKAKGDWILFVDSDEVVSKNLQKEIEKATETQECSGYYLRRSDVLFGRQLKHGETSRVRLLRLAKKGTGMWIRPVHEVWQVEGLVGELKNPLHHFPHPNVAQFVDEINNYSTINANYLHNQKVKVQWWHIPAYPVAKFLLNYFWRLGFLDGTAGAVVAIMMSLHSFLTRAKLYLLTKHDQAGT